MDKKYDFLIVGSGLYGSVFAHEANKRGYKCLVIEKRNHIGGNIYTENKEGINIHKYGPHIFHTSNKEIWDYVNSFARFNNFINHPIANYNGEIYNLPFNMNTFHKLWGVTTPSDAEEYIKKHINKDNVPKNLEEQAIQLVGNDIYEKLIKEYTEKQWGKKCIDLPSFIIKRLPLRFSYDNNYYNDLYQGVPIGGYSQIIESLLNGIEVQKNTDFLNNKEYYLNISDKIIYCGEIDKFYDYSIGKLDYRTVYFKEKYLDIPNFQGSAIVNFTSLKVPYTRSIEHKHFEYFNDEIYKLPYTYISEEYSKNFETNDEPFYPINDEKNNKLYREYKEMANQLHPNIMFCGRLGSYKYYDMDKIIEEVINYWKK